MFLPADGYNARILMDRILRQTNYNAWANTLVFDVIKTISEGTLMRPMGNSFSSICETLLHIWDAEFIWLNRLQGKPFNPLPSNTWKPKEGLHGWIDCSNELHAYCRAQESIWWEKDARYLLLSGEEQSTPHVDVVMHVTNHSTFHRGQIITMLRQAGITDLPSTDLIAFLRV